MYTFFSILDRLQMCTPFYKMFHLPKPTSIVDARPICSSQNAIVSMQIKGRLGRTTQSNTSRQVLSADIKPASRELGIGVQL